MRIDFLSPAIFLIATLHLGSTSLAYEPAAPWTAPPETVFIYKGLENDLEGLLKAQVSEHSWISMVTMTAKIKRFVVNCLYSLQKYGESKHYIVAVFDDVSLAECKKLNLPCFNATSFAHVKLEDGAFGFTHPNAKAMWWGKQRLSREILQKGYHVHGSDVDVVYFRRLHESYSRIFTGSNADGIFAAEEAGPQEPWQIAHYENTTSYINMINAGVYAIQSNNRSLNFFNHWVRLSFMSNKNDQVSEGRNLNNDQVERLNNMHTEAYEFCDSHSTCRSVQGYNKFALFRHQFFFHGTSCTQDIVPPRNSTPPCDTRRLYIHYLCHCCWTEKAERWKTNFMWFVDEDLKPIYNDGGGSLQHPYMPCEEKVAWPNWNVLYN